MEQYARPHLPIVSLGCASWKHVLLELYPHQLSFRHIFLGFTSGTYGLLGSNLSIIETYHIIHRLRFERIWLTVLLSRWSHIFSQLSLVRILSICILLSCFYLANILAYLKAHCNFSGDQLPCFCWYAVYFIRFSFGFALYFGVLLPSFSLAWKWVYQVVYCHLLHIYIHSALPIHS